MKKVSLEVNGKKVSKEVPDHTLLSVFLRDILNLTGTHVGSGVKIACKAPANPQKKESSKAV